MEEYKELKEKGKSIPSNNIFSKKRNIKIVYFDSFDANLNISDIKDEYKKIEPEKKNINQNTISPKIYIGTNFDKDFSADLDNISEDEFNERKISICSSQSEGFNYNNINININNEKDKKKRSLFFKKERKKIAKEDLNNIPLPVFSCIYCSNDEISFNHLSKEIISKKYLFQTSIFDIIELNKLITYQPIVDKYSENEKLLDIVVKNIEHINKYNSKDIINIFFKSKFYLDICYKELIYNKKIFLLKIENSDVIKKKDFYFKGINKISKNSLSDKRLFNNSFTIINNYNSLSEFAEIIPMNNNINNNMKNNNISNISINFNSISSNNNETGNNLAKDNNNFLVSIFEKIEKIMESAKEIDVKEEITDIFKFDMERKIKKNDIIWEKKYYDIWNPNISNDDFEYNNISLKKVNEISKLKKLKVNLLNSNDKLITKISKNSFIYKINKKLNISQFKSLCSTNNSSVNNNENENKIKNKIFIPAHDFSFIKKNININNSQIYKKKIKSK